MRSAGKFFILLLLLNVIMVMGINHNPFATRFIAKNKYQTSSDEFNKSQVKDNSCFSVQRTNYLGSVVRGETEINITGTLVSNEGQPITREKVYLYLNKNTSENLLAETITDDEGRFCFNVVLPLTTPLGNNSLIVYHPYNLSSGSGASNQIYIVTVYGRVSIKVTVQRRIAPLFLGNTTCDVYVLWDNGTHVTGKNLLINITLQKNAIGKHFYLYTDSYGHASFLINFTEAGVYNVSVYLLLNRSENFISPYVLAAEQILFLNGTINGIPVSRDSDSVKVFPANQIFLEFDTGEKVYYANRSGTVIVINGVFYNTTGKPTKENITVFLISKYYSETYNLTTNEDGTFSLTLKIDASYEPGIYHIYAHDQNMTTVDLSDNLTLYVRTITKIIEFLSNATTRRVSSGSVIEFSGIVIDSIDNVPLPNIPIDVILYDQRTAIFRKKIFTNNDGSFMDYVTLPNDLNSPVITLAITVDSNATLIGDSMSIDIIVYNYIVIMLYLNNTLFLWNYVHGTLLSSNQSVFQAYQNTSLRLQIIVTDDFKRPFSDLYVLITYNRSTFQGTLNETGALGLILKIISSGFLTINIPELNIKLNLRIEVISYSFSQQEFSPSIFYYLVFVSAAMSIISIIAAKGHHLRFRKVFIGDKKWHILLEEAKTMFLEGKTVEGLLRIRNALLSFSRELGVQVDKWMTLREIVAKCSEKVGDDDLIRTLNHLVDVYETVIYGLKKLSRKEIIETINRINKLISLIQSSLSEKKWQD